MKHPFASAPPDCLGTGSRRLNAPNRFAAYLGHLRLGVYAQRNNAGRRLLAVRRNVKGGWRRVRAGVWRNRQQKNLTVRIQPEWDRGEWRISSQS